MRYNINKLAEWSNMLDRNKLYKKYFNEDGNLKEGEGTVESKFFGKDEIKTRKAWKAENELEYYVKAATMLAEYVRYLENIIYVQKNKEQKDG